MRNQKGFTLLELMAVIVLATTVLIPMLSGLIGNYEVNARIHQRKAASSLAMTTIEAFNKVYYDDLRGIMDESLDNGDYVVELTRSDCDSGAFSTATESYNRGQLKSSQEICTMIFDQTWNSYNFTSNEDFKVFLYPYYLTETQLTSITSNPEIPTEAQNEIGRLMPSTETQTRIMRLTVWIRYDEETEQAIVTSGVVNNEQTIE